MASREVKLNSVLCYLMNSCRKYPDKIVKSIIVDFYDVDTVSNAKDILSADITSLDLNIKIPTKHRITTANKFKLDLEDIFSLIHAIDDLGASEKLPRYATDNLDELPVTRMDSGGLAVVVNKLDTIFEKLSTVNLNPSLQGPSGRMTGEARPPAVSVDSDGGGMLIDENIKWYDSAQDSVCEEQFTATELLNRRKRRKLFNAQRHQVTIASNAPAVSNEVKIPQTYSAITQKPAAPMKLKRIIGRSNDTDDPIRLKAAKPYVKKAVFGIYNVSVDETVESATNFVSKICGAQPINCFLVNTNNARDATRDTVKHPLAFRVCIDDQYSAKLLNPMTWANGIVIKPWKFKSKPRAPQENIITAQAQA